MSKYCLKDTTPDSASFEVFRILLMYHDAELCALLDTLRVGPKDFAQTWIRSTNIILFQTISTRSEGTEREREREREKDKNVQCFSVKSKPIQATVNCFSLQALATVLSLAPPPSASLFLSHTRSSTFFSDVG